MESNKSNSKIVINITGIHCASCVNKIEKTLNALEGVNSATVNLVTKKASIVGNVPQGILVKSIEGLGFGVIKDIEFAENEQENVKISSKPTKKLNLVTSKIGLKENDEFRYLENSFFSSALFTLPIMLISMLSINTPFALFLQFSLATVVVFFIGFGFTKTAVQQIRHLTLGMDTLIAIGSLSAYFYSILKLLIWQENELYFETAAMIVTLILFGRYLESKAKGKAGDAIKKLMELKPTSAFVIKNGREIETDISEISVGDEIGIRPGEKIPIDGTVIEGQTTIDESMITGECMPVIKKKMDKVCAGTVNQNGNLRIIAEKVGADTLIAQMITMVEEAQASKAPIQRIAEKVAAVFVPIVIGIAIITLIVWLICGYNFSDALISSIAVLVIACPCALGLATPTAVIVTTGRAAKNGILIRNATSLEQAVKTKVLILDKTGTITKGEPEVTGIYNVGDLTDNKIEEIVCSCERFSEHPIGVAVQKYAKEKSVKLTDVEKFLSLPGKGISSRYGVKNISIGNELLMYENNVDIERYDSDVNKLRNDGNTVFYLAVDGLVKAIISVADAIRESSKCAISEIKSLGITPVMLTGDDNTIAQIVAKKVGINQVKSRLRPDEKIKEIQYYKKKGNVVGMVGDGINDAPALVEADVSFAIGGGTDIAMEAAEITLAKGDISKVAKTIKLSRVTIKIIKQNLFWAFGYNFVALPIAALGLLNPMIAAGAMALSSVSVVANSLRLKSIRY